eukprot:TRINITY_DN67260_c0_g1_i1.p1 TRINITY_DN67260_c0_g1~~TRINITY_DN67260_c0_g1_i1.p1  ORF type:complete len:445 (+),score=134.71 TRINITY_DN67260_c0_g1_i1:62-1396(+)
MATTDLISSQKAWDAKRAARGAKSFSLEDMTLGRTIGKGRFARVKLATLKEDSQMPICLKCLKKSTVVRLEQTEHILNEKNVLTSIDHPFIIRMLETFQDAQTLYMVLELVNGGELFNLLRAQKKFKEKEARFYAAEAVSAVSYLHSMLVVFRDIKPENLLIHRTGHLKLTDFGFAKYLRDQKTLTLCGTPEYMAPEIISRKPYGLAVDWWSLGILFYEMMAGQAPFQAPEEADVYNQIVAGRVQYPPAMSKPATDIITRLLMRDPVRRLGSPEVKTSPKEHAFFKEINWDDVDNGRMEPPFLPEVESATSVDEKNFSKVDDSVDDGAVYTPPADKEDCFSAWIEAKPFREEALALAKSLAEERQLQKKEAEEREAAERARQEEEHRKKLEAQMNKMQGDSGAQKKAAVAAGTTTAGTLLQAPPEGCCKKPAGQKTQAACCSVQ